MSLQTIIIEDEPLAARRLQKLLGDIDGTTEILAVLESIESASAWLKNNPKPDLIFMDVQLSDGLCFEIFSRVDVDCPVVFITAFDEYAVRAFKVNSIDYLLKPIDVNELRHSIDKFKKVTGKYDVMINDKDVAAILNSLKKSSAVYKTRFLVKTGSSFIKIPCDEIAYIFVDNKLTIIVPKSNKKYYCDYTLDELEKELDPKRFFRANRQFIVSEDTIVHVRTHFSGKLKVQTAPAANREIIVSKEKAAAFKKWLGG